MRLPFSKFSSPFAPLPLRAFAMNLLFSYLSFLCALGVSVVHYLFAFPLQYLPVFAATVPLPQQQQIAPVFPPRRQRVTGFPPHQHHNPAAVRSFPAIHLGRAYDLIFILPNSGIW
jgi:hypothetical protein